MSIQQWIAPQQNNLIDTFAAAEKIKSYRSTNALNEMKVGEAEREAAGDNKLAEVLGRGGDFNDPVHMRELTAADPKTGLSFQKAQLEGEKTRAQTASAKAEALEKDITLAGRFPGDRGLVMGVIDKWIPDYPNLKPLAERLNGITDPQQFVKQLGAEGANFVSPKLVSDETVKTLRAEADETAARDEALMADPYGSAGNLAGHVAMGVALPGKKLLTAIGSAAGYGAAQPVGLEESRTENAATSAALGGAAGVGAKVVGRALKPVRSEVSRGIGKLMDYADSRGFKLSAGQRTGSRPLQNLEAGLDTLPTSGSPLSGFRDHNQKVANSIVAKEMGESGDAITPDVIEGARTRIGEGWTGLPRTASSTWIISSSMTCFASARAVRQDAQGTTVGREPIAPR